MRIYVAYCCILATTRKWDHVSLFLFTCHLFKFLICLYFYTFVYTRFVTCPYFHICLQLSSESSTLAFIRYLHLPTKKVHLWRQSIDAVLKQERWMQLELPFFENIASSQKIKKSPVKSTGTPNQWKESKIILLIPQILRKLPCLI